MEGRSRHRREQNAEDMATTEHREFRDFLYSWEAKMCGGSRGDRWKEREVDRAGLAQQGL